MPRVPTRYVLECVWSGYTASQSRPVHREVLKHPHQKLYADIHGVQFTDGTTMSVRIRPLDLREKVQEIHGYTSLLGKVRRSGMTGYVKVSDLP